MDSPDKMMQHLDASNKNAVFFLDLPNENYWLNPKHPKAALISPKQHSSTIAAPRGGQGGQKNQRMVVCCSLLDEKAKKKLLGKQR